MAGLTFLLALMGWMPAPLDIGVWPSLWILEKHEDRRRGPPCCRPCWTSTWATGHGGAGGGLRQLRRPGHVRHRHEFSASGLAFARQLIDMYTATLGGWSRWIIALVAFITMFSTTLTVLDGYARTLGHGFELCCAAGRDLAASAATSCPAAADGALAGDHRASDHAACGPWWTWSRSWLF